MKVEFRSLLVILVSFLLFSSCVHIPTQQEIQSLDYGSPLTIDYKKVIEKELSTRLFDPYSAHIEYEGLQKFWFQPTWEGNEMVGGRLSRNRVFYSGYMVTAMINAKNRFGAYIGSQRWGFLFKNNELVKVFESDGVGGYRQWGQSGFVTDSADKP